MIIRFNNCKIQIEDSCGLEIKEIISHATRAAKACTAINDKASTEKFKREYLDLIVPHEEIETMKLDKIKGIIKNLNLEEALIAKVGKDNYDNVCLEILEAGSKPEDVKIKVEEIIKK